MKDLKLTPAIRLLLVGGVAGALGWLLQVWLSASGYPVLRLHYVLALTLVVLAAVQLALAIPVRQAVKKDELRKLNPFYAFRVLVLGQASALTGALLGGFALGLLIWVLSKQVLPVEYPLANVVALVAGITLMVSGIVTEHFCTLPPDDGEGADVA